jgi:hypothetical protein
MKNKWHLGNKNGKRRYFDKVPHGKLKVAKNNRIWTS